MTDVSNITFIKRAKNRPKRIFLGKFYNLFPYLKVNFR